MIAERRKPSGCTPAAFSHLTNDETVTAATNVYDRQSSREQRGLLVGIAHPTRCVEVTAPPAPGRRNRRPPTVGQVPTVARLPQTSRAVIV